MSQGQVINFWNWSHKLSEEAHLRPKAKYKCENREPYALAHTLNIRERKKILFYSDKENKII